MNWNNVFTIYAKELMDSIRDRRTLISTIVIPVFMMPVFFFGFIKVATVVVMKAKEEIPRVMILGGEDSPSVRAGLEKTGKFKVETATADWKTLVSEKKVRAVVQVPLGFERQLALGAAPAIVIYNYKGELKSGFATDQLDLYFSKLRDGTTLRLLADKGLPASIARPFEVNQTNVAPPEKVGGNAIGGVIPYVIILLCFTGAMNPAMDLTAGEKERGTMETLLCSPAARAEIVFGKFLMVLTGSLAAVAFSLVSLVFSVMALGGPAASGAGHAASAPALDVSVDPNGIVGVMAMVVPVSVLFSAALFTIALFAKSFKEAQSYLAPIIFVIIAPLVFGMLPGIELNYRLAFVPILNLSLICKEMLSGVWHWGYIGVIFGSTAVYAAVALSLAVRMFRREDVIFRV